MMRAMRSRRSVAVVTRWSSSSRRVVVARRCRGTRAFGTDRRARDAHARRRRDDEVDARVNCVAVDRARSRWTRGGRDAVRRRAKV